jgi:hypothetical protein
VKRLGQIKRKRPLPRSSAALKRRKRLKATNAYHRKEWRALVRQVRKRSGGVCELRIRCNGAPAQGDPHHHGYDERFVGWRRLIVPLHDLSDTCYECHKAVHSAPGTLPPIEEDFLS